MAPLDVDDAHVVSISFEPDLGFEKPTIEIRNGVNGQTGEWRRMLSPVAVDGKTLEVRLRAANDPLILGGAFESELRDTWVQTGPSEEQIVPWHFESPSGHQQVVNAVYQGNHRWTVRNPKRTVRILVWQHYVFPHFCWVPARHDVNAYQSAAGPFIF